MDSDGLRNLIAMSVMILLYAALVFSKARRAGRGTKK
jgi:hypothetical protein